LLSSSQVIRLGEALHDTRFYRSTYMRWVGAIAVEIFDLLAWFVEHVKGQLAILIPIQLYIEEGGVLLLDSYCVA
jgi:hypothetical protein